MFKNNVFKPNVNTVKWFKCALTRAVKTMAQTAVAMIPVAVTITQVDWKTVIGTSLLTGLVSLLTSAAGIPEVESEGEI